MDGGSYHTLNYQERKYLLDGTESESGTRYVTYVCVCWCPVRQMTEEKIVYGTKMSWVLSFQRKPFRSRDSDTTVLGFEVC